MKKTLTLFVMFVASLLATQPCQAQDVPVLSFGETVWDFGSIKEDGGPVSHVFRFTNNSRVPVVLGRVQSGCSCTATRYDREPVKPGEEGSIEVTFNPAGFRGQVTKTVNVFYNNGQSRELLTIKADVATEPRSQAEQYPFTIAPGVRADKLHVPFGYIENGSVNSMTVELVNTSVKAVSMGVDQITGEGRLTASVPGELPAGETVTITVTYDLRGAKPVSGIISDRVYLSVDGRRCELSVNVSAIVTAASGS